VCECGLDKVVLVNTTINLRGAQKTGDYHV